MIHLHVRDREGRHSLEPQAYREAIGAIRRRIGDDLIIQATSESAGVYGPRRQMQMVRDLRPEAISLALREIVPDAAHETEAGTFLAWLRDERIMPQFIIYTDDEVARYHDLCRRGIIPGEGHFLLFVLGRYGDGRESDPREMLPRLAALDGKTCWAVCAFGQRESACVAAAATLGGHARVGFENNCHLGDGSLAPDNAALVSQTRAVADSIGRQLATAEVAREVLSVR